MLLGVIPTASSGVINLNYLPEVLICVSKTNKTLQTFSNIASLSIVNAGRQLVQIAGNLPVSFARLGAFNIGSSLATALVLADGKVDGQTTINISNASTTEEIEVYGVSNSFGQKIVNYVQSSINPFANQLYSDFETLLLQDNGSVDRVNLTFADGFNDDYTVPELRQLIGFSQNAQTAGTLDGQIVVDQGTFSGNPIVSAVVFNNGTAATVVGMKRLALNRI